MDSCVTGIGGEAHRVYVTCQPHLGRSATDGGAAARARGLRRSGRRAGLDVLVVAQETQAAWVRNFNPLLPNGAARWPTRDGIYEPMMVRNRVAGAWVPWLAERWSWTEDGRELRFFGGPG